MLKPFILGINLLLLSIVFAVQAAKPQVVVTLKPIHALVSGVMEGVTFPYLLLPSHESPHTYSLHPSQAKKLHAATLIVWVSPTLETFLEKTLTTLDDKTQILRLIDIPNLTLLNMREGQAWESAHHEEAHSHKTHSNLFEMDPHIWLSSDNAIIIVQTVAQTLTDLDATHADQYTANAHRLIQQLEQLTQTLKQQLAPLKNRPFLVFHDAYQYFEHQYQLTALGSISLSPEIRPSLKRWHQLRTRLKNESIHCVFSEPQFESALVTTLIEGTSVQRGLLDPLGIELVAGTESYFTLLRQLANSLEQCLLH